MFLKKPLVLLVTLNLVSWFFFTIQTIFRLMDQHQWLSLKMLRLSLRLMVGNTFLLKMVMIWKLLLKLSKKLKLRQINHLLSKLRQSLVTELKDKEHQLSTVLQLVKTALITQKVFTVTMHQHLQFQMKSHVVSKLVLNSVVKLLKMLGKLNLQNMNLLTQNWLLNTRLPLQMNLYTLT